MPTTRATKETANVLGVSVSTMRNWSDQYAVYLSDTARPGHLPERRFTEKDLAILAYIKQLRGEGMQAEQIKERLRETKFNDIEIIPQQATTDGTKDTSLVPDESAQAGQGGALGSIVASEYLTAIERRFDALERARESDKQMIDTMRHRYVIVFGFGFIAAGIMFLLLVMLSWFYGA